MLIFMLNPRAGSTTLSITLTVFLKTRSGSAMKNIGHCLLHPS